ncbi:BadF/BadG/BcrA/BcrD ATPase family protein [Roseivivax jejudonensis]|uniref:BadF/BadG/BcrA/BcrD ATPase family protein n=1 Tax=Roseivivax jejudonensis TaxID=1529041 RepID=UPI0013565BAD|nr:BadF/BadG/BcrA/BcrD ATPase family protein [Roseivivax jejudonensis]
MSPSGIIGIDGGGSGSRFALEDGGRRVVIARGPANVFSDFDGSLAVLREGLEALEADTGRSLAGLPVCLSVAGAIDDDVTARVGRALGLERVVVEEDWRAALRGAFAGGGGTLAGVGTGSFLARSGSGSVRAIGGHGAVLGDEASGAWIGKALLARTLHAAEGLQSPSPLTDAAFARHGGIAGIVAFARDADAAAFAALARDVAEAARAGDATATAILSDGAAYLQRAAHALGWETGEPFCLLGGLAESYADHLPPALAEARVAPRGSALDGALARARQLAETDA